MTSAHRWPLAIGLAAVIACAVALHAQQPTTAPSQPTFHSGTSDLVVLPVVVTDRQGRLVGDLPQSAFTVKDNGTDRPVLLFSNEDVTVSVGLVIDASFSMRPKMGEVVAAALRFAQLSRSDDELFVLAFNDDVQEVLPDRQFVKAGDTETLQQALAALRPDGRTSLYDGIMAGLDRLDRASRARRILIVFSDGGDNASETTLEEVRTRARRSNAQIYTIGLFDDDDRDRNPGVLGSLAESTGGARFLPRSAGPLLQSCERIAREIRGAYTVGYEPPVRDGRYRRISVSVTAPDRRLSARTRPGYVAPEQP